MPGGPDVAPGDGHAGDRAAAEVEVAGAPRRRDGGQLPAAPDHPAEVDPLQRGERGAARGLADGLEGEGEAGGAGEPPGQVGGQAVGGDHVEADPGEQGHAGGAGLGVPLASAAKTAPSPVTSR